jgi:hypothetical protein
METGLPPINEAVNLLSKFDPGALERLRAGLPTEVRPLLRPGGLAGVVAADLIPLAQVPLKALKTACDWCDQAIHTTASRLKRARLFRLVGGLAAAGGSASSVIVTITAWPPIGVYVGGVVALVGSLASLLSDYWTRLESGGSRTLFEVYADLVDKRYQAKRLSEELTTLLGLEATPEREQAIKDRMGQANAILYEVNKLEAVLLVSTPP